MDKCIENIEECKSQIIEEICAIQEPTPAHITHTLDLYYELDCLGEQARIQFENRKGVDLSEKACILKYEIYHYAKITQNTYLLDLIHYFDTQFTEFQRYKIPTNIQLNYTNLSKQNLLGTISYSMNPYGLDQTPAWVYDFEQKGSNVGTKPILPSCVDTLNRKMYFYCRTTCCGIHQFDLLKHSVVDIIPFPHEPKGICVDLDFLYVLTCEGRPITNGMMKINISTKTVIKKWSEKTRPEFFGFETDGTDSLFTLRRSSLCVFSKTTLSQLRELKLAQNPKFSGKINTFSIFSNSVYILPEDIQFDILVYSLSNGELIRTISLQVNQICTQICIDQLGSLLCNNFEHFEKFDLFSKRGDLIHSFKLPDKDSKLVSLQFVKPYIIVLCVLPGESLKIIVY